MTIGFCPAFILVVQSQTWLTGISVVALWTILPIIHAFLLSTATPFSGSRIVATGMGPTQDRTLKIKLLNPLNRSPRNLHTSVLYIPKQFNNLMPPLSFKIIFCRAHLRLIQLRILHGCVQCLYGGTHLLVYMESGCAACNSLQGSTKMLCAWRILLQILSMAFPIKSSRLEHTASCASF